MPTLYKTNGEVTEVSPKGKFFSLEELHGFVGGYIEYVRLPNGCVLVVNEEGLLEDLPINIKATNIVSFFGYPDIVGDALYLTAEAFKKTMN